MIFTPDPEQDLMTAHLLAPGKRKALYCGMGKGKTAATLRAICETIYSTAGGALVVAPLNVCLLTWPAEIELWDEFKWLRVANLRTSEGMLAWQLGTADIYLINWESLPKFVKSTLAYHRKGQRLPANILVYDELSKAKSHASKRVNLWRRFTYLFDYHWGLTGTPNPNSYLDLFAQFRLLCGNRSPLGTSFEKFKQEYFIARDWNQYKWDLRKGAKEEIEDLIRPMVLSLGAGDFPMEVIDWEVVLPPITMKFYRKLEKEMLAEIDGKFVEAINAAVLVQKLVQATSGQVYGAEREIVHTHTEKVKALGAIRKKHKGEPLLVVTLFKHERQKIMDMFPQEAEIFDVTKLDRWNAGKIKMLLIDPRSAAHGLNMQAGGHIITWFSQTYSREMTDQTNARLARKGQKNQVTVYRLMCPDTIDWVVEAVLRHKGDQQSALLKALSRLKGLHN